MPIWPIPDLTLARSYERIASTVNHAGAWRQAIAATRAARKRDPSDPEVLNRLGDLELAPGSLVRAREAYEAAGFWNPQSVGSRLGLARVEMQVGNQRASDRWCRRVKVIVPRVHCPLRS